MIKNGKYTKIPTIVTGVVNTELAHIWKLLGCVLTLLRGSRWMIFSIWLRKSQGIDTRYPRCCFSWFIFLVHMALLGKVTSGYSGFMVSVLALAVATTRPAAGGWCRSRGSPGAGVVYFVHFVPYSMVLTFCIWFHQHLLDEVTTYTTQQVCPPTKGSAETPVWGQKCQETWVKPHENKKHCLHSKFEVIYDICRNMKGIPQTAFLNN
jgi:hypothetical protein